MSVDSLCFMIAPVELYQLLLQTLLKLFGVLIGTDSNRQQYVANLQPDGVVAENQTTKALALLAVRWSNNTYAA